MSITGHDNPLNLPGPRIKQVSLALACPSSRRRRSPGITRLSVGKLRSNRQLHRATVPPRLVLALCLQHLTQDVAAPLEMVDTNAMHGRPSGRLAGRDSRLSRTHRCSWYLLPEDLRETRPPKNSLQIEGPKIWTPTGKLLEGTQEQLKNQIMARPLIFHTRLKGAQTCQPFRCRFLG